MKIPFSWLKDFIDLDLSPQDIAKHLTMAGLEVEAIETHDPSFDGVVVGYVEEVVPHPNADKLRIATVSNGKESVQVVCGAPNCRKGMKTAFAEIGASILLDNDEKLKIKKTKIRGVESNGMLASGKELRISDDADGILDLSDEFKLGEDLKKHFTEVVFEIALTPNLNYASSVFGVARELSSILGIPLKKVPLKFPVEETNVSEEAKVIVEAKKNAPRYMGRLVKDVRLGASPVWMQNRLLKAGFRPINNVVDITNYVLFERGHPLHAFDFDKICDKTLYVREAKENESLITLDGKERKLTAEDVVIADSNKVLAIAGVMGANNSEVGESTTSVFLEAAYFDPVAVRKTSKRQGLLTEASRRFERGADPNALEEALDRACFLLNSLAGGKVFKETLDISNKDFAPKIIRCGIPRVNEILGLQLSLSEVETLLRRLNFKTKAEGEALLVQVPTYRSDISQEIDLIEEVARLYGYENIRVSASMPKWRGSLKENAIGFDFERLIRKILLSQGLQEFLTCDLIGPKLKEIAEEALMPSEVEVSVLNPTSIEQSILRTSLMPGLLQVVKFNYDRQIFDIDGFEVGRIHFKDGASFREESMAAIVLMGKERPVEWEEKPVSVNFYDLKGVIENLFDTLGIKDAKFQNQKLKPFHDGRQASVFVGELKVGALGEVHPSILRKLNVSEPIYFAEFNLADLYRVSNLVPKIKEIPLYPTSERDWTLTLNDDVPFDYILDLITSVPSTLLESCQLVNVWKGSKLGAGLKNLTFRFVYRDRSKTLSQEEVDKEHTRICDAVRTGLVKKN